jgi:uncharacterized membrane protein YedE/YeeE
MAEVKKNWNPYVVGIGIGVLSWLAFAVVNAPVGITTALSELSGATATPILGAEWVRTNPYWAANVPRWNYGLLFLIGVFAGSLVAALLSRTLRLETVPAVWRERFGPSRGKRLALAFLGGVLAIFGARLAGGCTSGHGISGGLQLALSSWIFLLTMFAAGIVTAKLMFPAVRSVNDGGRS